MAEDAREIYEAVLGQIKKNLSDVVPVYVEQLRQGLEQEYGQTIRNLEKRVAALEESLKKAEHTERGWIAAAVKEAGGKNQTKSADKVNVSRYDIHNGYKFNGWIYYANEEMGEFLYKVRTDGTENQQLTDYSVVSYGMHVKQGRLYFVARDFSGHSIEL